MSKIIRNIFIKGPVGQLEAIFNPVDQPRFLGVICHPHPLYQGTMHNKVVSTLARALSEAGGAILRFNFRGVMKSEGSHDHGKGEVDDAKLALDFICNHYRNMNIPAVVAGFSFGSWVGLKMGASDERVDYLIGLGTPTANYDVTFLTDCQKPKLLVNGERDSISLLSQAKVFFNSTSPPKKIVIVKEADHFFTGKQHIIFEHSLTWIKTNLLQYS